MRLRNREPTLPPGEGEIYAHNSGFEHATRYSGIVHDYNPLRQAELAPLYARDTDLADISPEDFTDMLFTDKYEVIIAQQLDADHDQTRLVGMAIGQRKRTGEHATRMSVKELIVVPEMRRRHIAGYLLVRLTQNLSPTEMVVSTNRFVPEPWFIEGLESAGFRHTDSKGSPALWLPGQVWRGQANSQHEAAVENFERHMPHGWNGYGEFYTESDDSTQIRVYRDHRLKGIVRPIENSRRFDETFDDDVQNFTIADAGTANLDTLQAVTEKEAIIALLNNYELIK